MAKISFVLVISLLVVTPFRPVLSQDWMGMLNQVKQGGSLSEEDIQDATKAIGESGVSAKTIDQAEKAASQAPAFSAWIEKEDGHENAPSPAPRNSPAQEPAGSKAKSPANAPAGSKAKSPANAPAKSPAGSKAKSPANAPAGSKVKSPANAPAGSTANAPASSKAKSPVNAPTKLPAGSKAKSPAKAPAGSKANSPAPPPSDPWAEQFGF